MTPYFIMWKDGLKEVSDVGLGLGDSADASPRAMCLGQDLIVCRMSSLVPFHFTIHGCGGLSCSWRLSQLASGVAHVETWGSSRDASSASTRPREKSLHQQSHSRGQ